MRWLCSEAAGPAVGGNPCKGLCRGAVVEGVVPLSWKGLVGLGSESATEQGPPCGGPAHPICSRGQGMKAAV
jgi:hypothetical protein